MYQEHEYMSTRVHEYTCFKNTSAAQRRKPDNRRHGEGVSSFLFDWLSNKNPANFQLIPGIKYCGKNLANFQLIPDVKYCSKNTKKVSRVTLHQHKFSNQFNQPFVCSILEVFLILPIFPLTFVSIPSPSTGMLTQHC